MPEGDYVLPEPSEGELDQMAQYLALLNSDGNGATLNQFRVFYRKVGRGHLLKRLQTLEAQGRARSELRTVGGPVPFEFWYQVEE